MHKVQFYFDPLCPWSWITSRWLLDVQEERDIHVEWKPFSLALKNAGSSYSHMGAAESTLRILRLATALESNELIERLYSETGTRIHLDERNDDRILPESMVSLELPDDLLAEADNEERDRLIEQSMDEALQVVGDNVGVPIIIFETDDGSQGYFGPVISELPDKATSLKLWDGLSNLASTPMFWELKRTRTVKPDITSTGT